MINKDCNKRDIMIQLFVIIDDLMALLPVVIWNRKKAWRKAKMTASEITACVLFGLISGFKTIKDLHWDLISYYQDMFSIPCYKNFVAWVNEYARNALFLLCALVQINRQNSGGRKKYIDATCIAVCHNKRIFDHKVCKGFAQRWKSTMWWFFGFKVHIIIDDQGNLLSFSITPWNTDDRKVVRKMVKKLTWTLIADAGYVSEELRHDLQKQWILFLSWYKKTMKKLVTNGYHKIMKGRQLVETWFGIMKCWWNLVSSYARSVWGHFSRIIYNLLSYTLRNCLSNASIAIS